MIIFLKYLLIRLFFSFCLALFMRFCLVLFGTYSSVSHFAEFSVFTSMYYVALLHLPVLEKWPHIAVLWVQQHAPLWSPELELLVVSPMSAACLCCGGASYCVWAGTCGWSLSQLAVRPCLAQQLQTLWQWGQDPAWLVACLACAAAIGSLEDGTSPQLIAQREISIRVLSSTNVSTVQQDPPNGCHKCFPPWRKQTHGHRKQTYSYQREG